MNVKRDRVGSALLALMFVGCASEPESTSTATQELQTYGHTQSTLTMVRRTKLNPSTPYASELYWFLDNIDAAFWVNDPDCKNNDCGAPSYRFNLVNPPTEGLAGAAALCWALRNPDHFSSNPIGGWQGANWFQDAYSVDFTNDLGGNALRDKLARYIPRDNHDALAWFRTAARSSASRFVAKRPLSSAARASLRLALNACHYAEDQAACGHASGNQICLPNPTGRPDHSQQATPECRDFVERNAPLLLPDDASTALSIATLSSAVCPLLIDAGFQINPSVTYAAAERYIRHHARGVTLTDSTQGQCSPACPSGECLNGEPNEVTGSEWQWQQNACNDVLRDTLQAIDDNKQHFMSRLYQVDDARQCRKVSNHLTCTLAGGSCSLAGTCTKRVSTGWYAEQVTIGSCNESVSFGGNLLPPCDNTNKAPATCADKCRSVNGYIDDRGKCMLTTQHTEAWLPADRQGPAERDVTGVVCGADLKSDTPGHETCTEYSNATICYQLGGTCVEGGGTDGFGACADRTPHPDIPYINQDFNAIGSCDDGQPFSLGMPANCYPRQPRPDVQSTIKYCMGRTTCFNDNDCCYGERCGAPGTPFIRANDGTDVCQPVTACGYQWIGFRPFGPGSVTLLPGSGSSTTCPPGASCTTTIPDCGYVTLTAAPNNGARLMQWTGCDSTNGATCTVKGDSLRSVSATFATGCTPTTSCAQQNSNCGTIWNGCSYETCGNFGGGCGSGETCDGNNQCHAACTPTTCAQQGKDCGTIWNGCGWEACGSLGGNCPAGQACDGNNQCHATCTPTTSCSAQGMNCGAIWNGCGYENCGACNYGEFCSASNRCQSACTPTTSCAAQGRNCGTIWNGCSYESCGWYGGGCPSGTCDANGQCQQACSPYTSCAAQGRSCGTIWNGCSYESCGWYGGNCPSGTCNSSGQCEASCTPSTSCAAQGRDCGSVWNGCNYETCGWYGGGCPFGSSCSAAGSCANNSSAPSIGYVVNPFYGTAISPWTTIVIGGSGFSASGNQVRLHNIFAGDVWLWAGDGHYFYESTGQINASLDQRVWEGTWEVTVRDANGVMSPAYTIYISD